MLLLEWQLHAVSFRVWTDFEDKELDPEAVKLAEVIVKVRKLINIMILTAIGCGILSDATPCQKLFCSAMQLCMCAVDCSVRSPDANCYLGLHLLLCRAGWASSVP